VKKQKSLRQLAKELGVSHSYLSQVLHGKRPASERVQKALGLVSMVSKSEARFGTSNPSGGIRNVSGGFDSHTLPPTFCSTLFSTLAFTSPHSLQTPCPVVFRNS